MRALGRSCWPLDCAELNLWEINVVSVKLLLSRSSTYLFRI